MTALHSYRKRIVLGSASKQRVRKGPCRSWDHMGLEVEVPVQILEHCCLSEVFAVAARLRLAVVGVVAAAVVGRGSGSSGRRTVVDRVRGLRDHSIHDHPVCWYAHHTPARVAQYASGKEREHSMRIRLLYPRFRRLLDLSWQAPCLVLDTLSAQILVAYLVASVA